MSFIFSEYQKDEIQLFWRELNCSEKYVNKLITELLNFMEHYSPKLIKTRNSSSEIDERENYLSITNNCKRLLRDLKKVPQLERINALSPRESRLGLDIKSSPINDPFEYIEYLMVQSEKKVNELKKYRKYERQVKGLSYALKRIPCTRGLKRVQFIRLFCILYDDENLSSKLGDLFKIVKYKDLNI